MISLALRYAARELRLGAAGLRVALACLALGVATIASVGGLRDGILAGLAADARSLLGGDIAIQGSAPLPESLSTLLVAHGARLAMVVHLRSLLGAPNGDHQLVEVKAVDAPYPVAGAVGLDPPQPLTAAFAQHDGLYGLVADPLILQRLSLRVGDHATLGTATLVVRAALTAEPDRVAGPFTLGPTVLIPAAALPATGLIQPGSLVTYELRAALPPTTDPAAIRDVVRTTFPGTGWRIRLATDGAPGLQRFIDQAGLFLTLVGLSALLVGGVGVGMGVRGWLEGRARSIAILRCLGAPQSLVFATYLLSVLALAVAGILVGLLVGAILPAAALTIFADQLPAPPQIGLYPAPLARAGAYGLLVSLLFALWPLARAARLRGAHLFRDAILPDAIRPTPTLLAATALLLATLVGLTLLRAPDPSFALGFCIAAALALILFRAAGALVMFASSRAHRPHQVALRLGIGALHAPGSPAAVVLVALGLGLAILATLGQVRGNIERELSDQIPADAPSFFVIDLQRDQLAAFDSLADTTQGVSDEQRQPSLRARVVSLDGIPADQVKATPDTRWALDGDRGLTWAATPPPGTRLVAGQWWPADYTGKPLVSLDATLARGWGVGLGGTIRVNVDGRDIDLTVASLRDVAWRSLSLNFTMIVSPGLIQAAPQTDIASLRATPPARAPLLRAIAARFPNVTPIDITEVLATFGDLLSRIAAGLAGVGTLALLSGALVMAGAVAATQQRRIADAVILKTLGATGWQIRAAWLVEFAVLGLAAGILALGVGAAASWTIMRFVLHTEWHFAAIPGILTLGGSLVAALALGLIGAEPALRERPARRLRNP
jgi:putative ABC transport system permease protein